METMENEKTINPAEEAEASTADESTGAAENAEEATEKSEKEEKVSKKAKKEIEALKTELADSNDKYLRLAAEYENYRKRTAKEKSDAYSDAYSDAIKAILPLADSLDKALEFSPKDDGIKALCKQFSDILSKIGITVIESDGKEFDPNLHNAIMHGEDENMGENMVSQTFQKGYMLKDKVIRHAMVKVVN